MDNSIPSILVVFGVTGDLATKKIIPSLWRIHRRQLLPEYFSVIGFSRKELSDRKFREFIRAAIARHGGNSTSASNFSRFFAHFSYQRGTFEDEDAFQILAQSISDKESAWGVCANKLFYLAAPPSTHKPIFENLAHVKLNVPCGGDLGWSRVLIEKPFGVDLKSAQSLQALLSKYFTEEQIYRIDHYLFKEIVQGIENFRFSNNLFENTWDNTTIERIDIRLHESVGVEGRGSFYDAVGALRDVGQNHLLAMLATLLMESPTGTKADILRKNRARILQALAPWTRSSIQRDTFRAQYKGYRKIDGVRRNSVTETHFALKTELNDPRWQGVPIFMEAGKRLREARKEIVVTLKHPRMCFLCEVGTHRPNKIAFRLEPNDEITIHFWTKKPGFSRVLEERSFSFFLYKKEVKVQYVEEYAKVLYAAMIGDQRSFVAPEEIEAAWQFTNPIVKAWNQNTVLLAKYKRGTTPQPLLIQNVVNDTHDRDKSQIGLPAGRHGKIGIVGLGKMGSNIALRLIEKNWKVVGFNKTPVATKKFTPAGFCGAYSLQELIEALQKPRIIWLMVPHKAVDEVLREFTPLLSAGDIIIDGGNSFYKDTIARYKKLAKQGIHFIDVGVSGGPRGALEGASIMVGGEKRIFAKLEPLFADLSVKNGYQFFNGPGAGHFVKMVHNGIEYGMMQAIAEGFAVMKQAPYKLDLTRVAQVYNHGSVIESRLMNWLEQAFASYGRELKGVSGSAAASGEGAWTVETAHEFGVSDKVIHESVRARRRSRKKPSYQGKVISALRGQFGGHSIK